MKHIHHPDQSLENQPDGIARLPLIGFGLLFVSAVGMGVWLGDYYLADMIMDMETAALFPS